MQKDKEHEIKERGKSMNIQNKRLTKSRTDRKICGVCGGLAEYLNLDPTFIRLAWVLLVLAAGTGIFAYILAAIIMPEG